AVVLIIVARRSRDAGPARSPRAASLGAPGPRRFVVVLLALVAVVIAIALLGLLAGYQWVRLGDIAQWLRGEAPPAIAFALDERSPRIAAALAAGAGLALAGSMVQSTCRNPLAEPGILGITGGAGVGAVLAVTVGSSTRAEIAGLGVAGGLIAFAVVYGLSWRGGLDSDRIVLVGIGMWYLTIGLSTFLLLRANPFDTPRIYTWLSGTTYGRTWADVLPVLVALAVVLPIALARRRDLDLLAIDDDTPRLAGLRLERTRLVILVSAAVLTALSVSAVGVVGFVGLVAPHAARALIGGRHSRILWVAMAIGAAMLGVADTLGRTLIAPSQIPAGLLVALIGAPYFIYLLARTRA
ncbi:MAG: iron chelate uptake ABC transporter family permease subunit, partial [Nocardioidaceae bacterium]|nr:iron chelate uptake ABC transporter family permease subunit [Nocardioidaceae bacterium]